MGLSTSKQQKTTKPIYDTQITGAANTLSNVYNANAGKVQGYADQIGGLIPSLLDKYQNGDAGVNAAKSYITSTLSGTGENPFLQGMIDNSLGDTTRAVNANMGTRGLTGGSAQAHILAAENAKAAQGLRYSDYNTQQQLKAQAAGMAPGMAMADYASISPLLSAAGTASGLPMDAASQYANGMGGLLGQYTNQVSTKTPSTADQVGKGLQVASNLFSMFSDERLKTDISRVGVTDGGLPVYTYRYGGQGPFYMGVMAQEVEAAQPDALGPEIAGYKTVNYAEVR